MAMTLQCGVVKQGTAGLMGMQMAQGAASTESKFLSLIPIILSIIRFAFFLRFPRRLFVQVHWVL